MPLCEVPTFQKNIPMDKDLDLIGKVLDLSLLIKKTSIMPTPISTTYKGGENTKVQLSAANATTPTWHNENSFIPIIS